MLCNDDQKVEIIQGQSANIPVRIQYKRSGNTLDLTGVTEITAIFPTPVSPTYPNGYFEKKLSLSQITVPNPGGGQIVISLAPEDTLLISECEQTSFEVHALVAGVTTICQLVNKLKVLPSLFPGA